MPALNSARFGRRGFLQAALAGAGAVVGARLSGQPAFAARPIVRRGGAHMKLSLAAYSFHKLLPYERKAADFKDAPMVLEDVIHFAADQNLDGVELTSYYFPTDLDSKYLFHLKDLTFRLGLDISGTAIRNDFCLPAGEARKADLAHTRRWIDYAAEMGAPVIRIFAGSVPKGDSEAAAIERCIDGINESLTYAAQKGVFLALENHGGITATPEQMLMIVHGVKDSPWFGVNFDSGNFATADPYADLEKSVPYAINVQVKVEMSPGGKKGPADLARVVRILKEAKYRGYVVLEYEADADPLEAVPTHLKKLRELIS